MANMTVRQLIEHLSQFDEDLPVVVRDAEESLLYEVEDHAVGLDVLDAYNENTGQFGIRCVAIG